MCPGHPLTLCPFTLFLLACCAPSTARRTGAAKPLAKQEIGRLEAVSSSPSSMEVLRTGILWLVRSKKVRKNRVQVWTG
jgi:hypothetical protein